MSTRRRLAVLTQSILWTVLLIAAVAQTQTSSSEAINQGVADFKAGRYPAASEDFKKAVALDPTSTTAKLYLATAYSYQVVPNLNTPQNLAIAENAIQLLKEIPDTDPRYHNVLKQLAYLYRNIGHFDETRDTELAALKLQPDDAEAHYTIGVIDWTQAYKFAVTALSAEGLADDGLGNAPMTPATCAKIKAHNTQLVDDAILHLTRATELNPNDADAMQYLNLIYRRRAALQLR
jgi:tetratricopeptide (TPR) repeat protein